MGPRLRGDDKRRGLRQRKGWNGTVSIPRLELAEHHVDRLHLGVAQKLVDPLLAAEAGVLQPAERRAVEVAGGAVDPDVARLDSLRGAERGLEIIGEDRGR